jgi:uncharacterized protein YdiU (UPF0061 family)
MPPAIASFRNSYATLPERFFTRQEPTPVSEPGLVALNQPLADELGLALEHLSPQEITQIFCGNRVPHGAACLSTAYAGHQFGVFVPQLGDGRAILIGEIVDRSGARREIQWKGTGRTRYSRGGDGRAALGPVLREYLVSEAMHALGIPTTRALAAVVTGEPVFRERPLPGAVLTRVAASHVRVGTFQFFAARGDQEAVQRLADYVIELRYPAARRSHHPYLALLQAVSLAQAELVARWMSVGFVHGVMNTDNMAVSGETIDFGPCAFMEGYDPQTVFSSIDGFGRYAYGRQPQAAHWNLARLAESLLALIDADEERAVALAKEAIGAFAPAFERAWLAAMRGKLGLAQERVEDAALVSELLDLMHEGRADFTLTFRRLAGAAAQGGDPGPRELFPDPSRYDAWAARWRSRLAQEARAPQEAALDMLACNPAYIPRNHRVEQALQAAEDGDFGPFRELQRVLARPYEERERDRAYSLAAAPGEVVERTFCGT